MRQDTGERKRLDPRRIARSIDKSKARKDIHLHLCIIYPKGETSIEISEATGYDERNVLGALIGDGDRYKFEDALVTLEMVAVSEDKYHGSSIVLYYATSNGNDINELLKSYALHNKITAKLNEYINNLEEGTNKIEGKLRWKIQ